MSEIAVKFSNEALAEAESILRERKNNAQLEHDSRVAEIERKFPEFVEINRTLSGALDDILKTMSAGSIKENIEKIAQNHLDAQQRRRTLLKAFGYPEDYLDFHYTCPKCKDTGFVKGIRCECFDELLKQCSIQELSRSCRIKFKSFDDFSLDKYIGEDKNAMSDILDDCKRYAGEFGESSKSLLFIGGTGLGKTHISSAIANAVIAKGYSVAFDSISNFLLKTENERFGRTVGDTMSLLLSADLLILDDLGSEFKTSYNDSVLYELVNTRINYGKPMIISTNLSVKELSAMYNERMVSRLLGCFELFEFVGTDRRIFG